jgi:hypothetical protein
MQSTREINRMIFPLSLYFNSPMTQYYRHIHVVLLVIAEISKLFKYKVFFN